MPRFSKKAQFAQPSHATTQNTQSCGLKSPLTATKAAPQLRLKCPHSRPISLATSLVPQKHYLRAAQTYNPPHNTNNLTARLARTTPPTHQYPRKCSTSSNKVVPSTSRHHLPQKKTQLSPAPNIGARLDCVNSLFFINNNYYDTICI